MAADASWQAGGRPDEMAANLARMKYYSSCEDNELYNSSRWFGEKKKNKKKIQLLIMLSYIDQSDPSHGEVK